MPTLSLPAALPSFLGRPAVAISVYVAFSAAVVAGIWGLRDTRGIAVVFTAVAALLALSFGGAWALGGLLKLARPDRITLLFSGAQKSISVGAPLAATLFSPAIAAMVLVPILDRKSTRLNSSHSCASRLPSSA